MGRGGDWREEIQEAQQELHEYKNPVIHKEWGRISANTVFDIGRTLNQEDFEDNSPVDEDEDLNIERFFDFKTGKLLPNYFVALKKHIIWDKTYQTVYVPNTDPKGFYFLIDFANKKNFPGLPKGTSGHIKKVGSFWWKEVVILSRWMDEVWCIGSDKKQIWDKCLEINLIKYGDVDILEFANYLQQDYSINDFRTRSAYLGSDGFNYKKVRNSEKAGEFLFEKIIKKEINK